MARKRKPSFVPNRHEVRHRVFHVGGASFDRLDQAMAAAGRPYRDEDGEPRIDATWEDRPVQRASTSRAVKKSGYKKKRR